MAKQSKRKVHYRRGKPTRRCGICTMFRPPDSCSAVEGNIEPQMVCDLYQRKTSFYGKSRAAMEQR